MTDTSARLLVVDDEMVIRVTMSDLLQRRGYDVTMASSGEEALALIHEQPFDLLLLDLKMPGLSGLEVAQRVRERQTGTAIIILTGHGSLESAVESIHLGVFDYLLKTASPQEVLARVASALEKQSEERRRADLFKKLSSVLDEFRGSEPAAVAAPEPSEGWIAVGELEISSWKQMARLGGQTLNLTPTEFRILVCLAQQAGQVMSYQEIVRCAQGYDAEIYEATELVKPHIYHLRQKIEPEPSNPRYILTVRGTGYLLSITPASKS